MTACVRSAGGLLLLLPVFFFHRFLVGRCPGICFELDRVGQVLVVLVGRVVMGRSQMV